MTSSTHTTFFGWNKISELEEILKPFSLKRIFLVTGKHSYDVCGAKGAIEKSFSNCDVLRFSGFKINPELEDVTKGIDLFHQHQSEVILAVGGGSPMDMAKLIGVLAPQKSSPQSYVLENMPLEDVDSRLILVPTTSGTGSEETHFAALYHQKTKYSLAHKSMMPLISIVDPSLTQSVSPQETASTGMDAFCHAVESIWNIYSTEESKAKAQEALELCLKYLPRAVNNPDQEAREGMARAANLAGKAINITKTTACHAMSYILTSQYGIRHGHAVALTLGEMIDFISQIEEVDNNDPRGVNYVKSVIKDICHTLGCSSVSKAKVFMKEFMQKIGLETNFSEFDIHVSEATDLIVQNINLERLKNNPRRMDNTQVPLITKQIA